MERACAAVDLPSSTLRRNHGRRGRLAGGAGFTLIEVLLALAVAGTALVALLLASTKCLAVARLAKNYENARHFLDWVDVSHPIDEKALESGGMSGTCDGPPDGYEWSREIEPVGEEDDGFYRVTTRITWSDRGSNAFEEVTTLLYVGEKEGQ